MWSRAFTEDRDCFVFFGVRQPAGIPLSGKMEVYLRLLDGSSKRRLRITCPIVEYCPPECILLGAGTNAVRMWPLW